MQGLRVSSSSIQEVQVAAGSVASQNFCALNNHFYCVENSTWGRGEIMNWSGFAKALYFPSTSLLLEGLFV